MRLARDPRYHHPEPGILGPSSQFSPPTQGYVTDLWIHRHRLNYFPFPSPFRETNQFDQSAHFSSLSNAKVLTVYLPNWLNMQQEPWDALNSF